jgi:hypothetical protein
MRLLLVSLPGVGFSSGQPPLCALLGQWIYYRLHPQLPEWLLEVLQVTLDANQAWIVQDANRLASMEGRPVRQVVCC